MIDSVVHNDRHLCRERLKESQISIASISLYQNRIIIQSLLTVSDPQKRIVQTPARDVNLSVASEGSAELSEIPTLELPASGTKNSVDSPSVRPQQSYGCVVNLESYPEYPICLATHVATLAPSRLERRPMQHSDFNAIKGVDSCGGPVRARFPGVSVIFASGNTQPTSYL